MLPKGTQDHLVNLVVTSGPGATNVVTALTDAYMGLGTISLHFSQVPTLKQRCISRM